MKNIRCTFGCVLFSAMVTALGFSVDSKEDGWRGINRDGKVVGFVTPESWPGRLTQVWKVNVGLGDASPVLVNKNIYLLTKKEDSEVIMCLNAVSGEKAWESVNNPAPVVTGGAASHPGPRSTPYIVDDKIVTIGAGGYINCRNIKNGGLIWSTDKYTSEVPQFFVAVSPLVVGNKVIAHLLGKENGTIVALDINTGKEIWTNKEESSTYSSPVMMKTFKNMVAVQGEKNLAGVSVADGTVLWKTATPAETRFYNSSTPLIYGPNVIIAGQGSGTKSFRITKEGESYTVSKDWENTKIGVAFNTPVLKDGFLYGNDARFGYIFCLNAKTGATCWVDSVKNNRFASVLDLGKVMVSLPANGQMIFFKPDPAAYKEIMRYTVADTEVYAHPLFSGNMIFVKDKEHLACWSFR